jgi:hypothetical protein
MNRRRTIVVFGRFLVASAAAAATVVAAEPDVGTDQAEMDRLFPGFCDRHTAGLWPFDEPQYLNMRDVRRAPLAPLGE